MTSTFSMSLTDENDIFAKDQQQFALLNTEPIFKGTSLDVEQTLKIIEGMEDYLSLD